MSGKATKVEILRNEAQSQVEYSEKTSCFELKLHVQDLPTFARLDAPGHLDYFSYPQHGQKCVKKVLEAFEVKKFTQSST